MNLTKSSISLHEAAGPTPRSFPELRVFRGFSPLLSPPFGPASGSCNGPHLKSKFLAVTVAKAVLGVSLEVIKSALKP